MFSLELLSPAKNLECGMAAISHGADAVYIGAERFGARSAAGNPLSDIAALCKYAHVYGAKVYVTVNTIIYDDELSDTEKLINALYEAGADAILVQDMGILEMSLPPIELHASTQTDNRTADKVEWLASHGFRRVVLARELSLDEIRRIHEAVPAVELEAFVHGALCVSYSGQCYASQYCFRRSANRGECAQFCRLAFDLEDAGGNKIIEGRHLLSLKDMCRIDYLGQMAEAGVTSFKIEGRLKDITYVKNVTAAYSQALDELVRRNPDKYCRASAGRCTYSFTPDLDKTFNRGFTDYFLVSGRDAKHVHASACHAHHQPVSKDITSFDTPKAIGEHVGHVKEIRGGSFTVAGTASFANGDGLCFFTRQQGNNVLEGFRVNRVEGNRIFPLKMPRGLRPGIELYRNNDQAFEKLLAHKSAERRIPLTMTIGTTDEGFALAAGVDGRANVSTSVIMDKQQAVKPQRENIVKQLSKLGNTPYECAGVTFSPVDFNYFIPSSVLADMRRSVVEKLENMPSDNDNGGVQACAGAGAGRSGIHHTSTPCPPSANYNISNRLARKFYAGEGLGRVPEAYELSMPHEALLMQCRHCIRYSLGRCVRHGGRRPEWREPLFLSLPDGRRFRLEFDCRECKMNVYADK